MALPMIASWSAPYKESAELATGMVPDGGCCPDVGDHWSKVAANGDLPGALSSYRGWSSSPLFDNLLGPGRQGRTNGHSECEKPWVPGELLQGLMHEAVGTFEVTAPMGEVCCNEPKLWSAKRRVSNQPVEAVLRFGTSSASR